jgi:hypothetical protein
MAILTVDEVREHVVTQLGDDALQRLLDAAEYLIVERAGPAGARTEVLAGGYRLISVSRPIDTAQAIAITERSPYGDDTVTTLQANDFLIHSGGMLIERLTTGDHARSRWYGRPVMAYTPLNDAALRAEVQIDLVKAALSYNPGLTMQQIGSWSEQYAANSVWNNASEREAILDRLSQGLGMVVV